MCLQQHHVCVTLCVLLDQNGLGQSSARVEPVSDEAEERGPRYISTAMTHRCWGNGMERLGRSAVLHSVWI